MILWTGSRLDHPGGDPPIPHIWKTNILDMMKQGDPGDPPHLIKHIWIHIGLVIIFTTIYATSSPSYLDHPRG